MTGSILDSQACSEMNFTIKTICLVMHRPDLLHRFASRLPGSVITQASIVCLSRVGENMLREWIEREHEAGSDDVQRRLNLATRWWKTPAASGARAPGASVERLATMHPRCGSSSGQRSPHATRSRTEALVSTTDCQIRDLPDVYGLRVLDSHEQSTGFPFHSDLGVSP